MKKNQPSTTICGLGLAITVAAFSGTLLADPDSSLDNGVAVCIDAKGIPATRIDNVSVRPGSEGLRITGDLHRPVARRDPVPGHFHVTAYGKDKAMLVQRSYRWGDKPYRSRWSKFMIDLPASPKVTTSISIVHHRDGEEPG